MQPRARFRDMPGWREAVAEALARGWYPPLAIYLAGDYENDLRNMPRRCTAEHLLGLAGIIVRHNSIAATGAQKRRALRAMNHTRRIVERQCRRDRAVCTANGRCYQCYLAPAHFECADCGGTGLAVST